MKSAAELRIGDTIKTALPGDKPNKTPIVRVVDRVVPRTGFTYVETRQKHNVNSREVWELRSDQKVETG